jgi:hypothetical protein
LLRSLHSGFIDSISLIFHLRVICLISFSRAIVNVNELLEIDEAVGVVAGREGAGPPFLVLENTAFEVVGDASIERTREAAHYVYAITGVANGGSSAERIRGIEWAPDVFAHRMAGRFGGRWSSSATKREKVLERVALI